MKFVKIKCLLLIFIIIMFTYCETARNLRSTRSRMKLKLKTVNRILKDMNSMKKFESFFSGFIKTALMKLMNQASDSISDVIKIVQSQIQGSCSTQAFAFYENFIKEERNKSGKRAEILDEIYSHDNTGKDLRLETRKRCELLTNALKDGTLKKGNFLEKIGNGLLSLVSVIPMPSFMKKHILKLDDSTKTYLEENVKYIEDTLSKKNLEYLKSVQKKYTFKEDTSDFIKSTKDALDAWIIGKKDICEIWSEFSDVSTTLFIQAFVMAGFDGLKCGAKVIQTIKDIDKTITDLKNLKQDIEQLNEYKDLVDVKNLNGVLTKKSICNVLSKLTGLSDGKLLLDLFCSEKFSMFSLVSIQKSLKSLKDKTQLQLDSFKHKTGQVINNTSNSISSFFVKSDFCALIKTLNNLGIKEIDNFTNFLNNYICELGSFKKYTNFITQTLEKGKDIDISQDSFCKLMKEMISIGLSDYYIPLISGIHDFYCNSGANQITKIRKVYDEIKKKIEEIQKENSKLTSEVKNKLKTSIGTKDFCNIIDAFKNINLVPDLTTLLHVLEGVLCDKSDFLQSITNKKEEILNLIRSTVNHIRQSSKIKVESISSGLIFDKKTLASFFNEITKIVKIDDSSIFIQFLKKWLKLPAPEIDYIFASFSNLIGNFFQPLHENLKTAISDNNHTSELINKLKGLNEDLKGVSEFKLDYKKIPSGFKASHIQSLGAFIRKMIDLSINAKDADKDLQQALSKIIFYTSIQMNVLNQTLKSVFDLLATLEDVKNSLNEDIKKDLMLKLDSEINAAKDFSEEKKEKLKDHIVIKLQLQLKDKLKAFGNPKKIIEDFKNKFKDMLSTKITNLVNESITGNENSVLLKIKNQIDQSLIANLKTKFTEVGKNGIEKVKESIANELINDFSLKINQVSDFKNYQEELKNKIKEDFKKEITEKVSEIGTLYSEQSTAAEGMKAKLKAELEKEMSDILKDKIQNINKLPINLIKVKEDLMSEEISSLKEEMIKQINTILTEKIKALNAEYLLDKVKNQLAQIKKFSEVLSFGEKLINLNDNITKLYANNDLSILMKKDGIKIKSKEDFDSFLKKEKESISQKLKKEQEDLLKRFEDEKQKALQLPNKDEILETIEAQKENSIGLAMKNYEEKMKLVTNLKQSISKKHFCNFLENNNSFGLPSENIFNIIIRDAFCDSVILAKIMSLKDEVQIIKESALKEKINHNLILLPKKEILNLLNNHIEIPTSFNFQSLALMLIKDQFGESTLIQTFIETVGKLEEKVKDKVNNIPKFQKKDICELLKIKEGFLSSVLSFAFCGVELSKNLKNRVDMFKQIIDMNSQRIKVNVEPADIKGLLSKQDICDFYKIAVPVPEKGMNLPFILHHYIKKFLCGKGVDINEIKTSSQAKLNKSAQNIKSELEDKINKTLQKEKLEKAYSKMGITNKTDVCKIVKEIKKLNLLSDDKKLIEKLLETVFCDESFKFSDFGKGLDLQSIIGNLVKNILEDVAAGAAASLFPPALIYFSIKFIFVNFNYIYGISKYIISGDDKNEAEVKQLFEDLGSMIAKNLIP